MAEKRISPDVESARKILDELWQTVMREKDGEKNSDIEMLIDSRFVSIRFCLPTQLLGKLTAPELDCLCLQKGDATFASQWDPRSFANKVIVPWVAENQYVLGTSTDPYVSKPLRKAFLEENPGNVKGKEEWILLYRVLREVESRNSEEYTRRCMLHALRSIHKKFSELIFEYFVPERISIEQTENLIVNFLSEASGGDRGLSVAAALFETFGQHFKIYKEVRRHAINASDQATDSAGDIECIGEDGELKLAIEVKERNLTLTDVRSAVLKARKVSLTEILFNSPGTSSSEEENISELIAKTWASGTNLYRLSIVELIRVGLSLTGELGRKDFLKNVEIQLDTYNTQPNNRKRWKELLEEI
ncbi:MAG: restriction endonuclease, SacI family [Candidatus Electrothrix sp. AUS1_2]|nr:restriction endonuclease, SacI family [Candidatus Electrothrix sp. AUS1_2]